MPINKFFTATAVDSPFIFSVAMTLKRTCFFTINNLFKKQHKVHTLNHSPMNKRDFQRNSKIMNVLDIASFY
jgi:hypothetical protein